MISKKTLTKLIFGLGIFTLLGVGIFGVQKVKAENVQGNNFGQGKEKIESYHTNITINKDASISVEEIIKYNPGKTKGKHGVFREIPLSYKTGSGNKRTIRISKINILIDGKRGEYTTSRENGNINLRIGSANKIIHEPHIYHISYKIQGAINYFSDHDELYWNVVGDRWPFPVQNITATVQSPEIIKQTCFQGVYGSKEECLIEKTTSKEVHFKFRNLMPMEMATVVIGIKKGIIYKPNLLEKWWAFLRDNWILVTPLGFFIWAFRRWWQHGRDPKGRGTIIPYYDVPENLSVAEVSAIVYNQLRTKDISAMIVDLAVKGYLKIRKNKVGKIFKHTQYTFLKTNKSENDLTEINKFLLDSLFEFSDSQEVTTDDLKNKFYKKVKKLQQKVIKLIRDKEYLPKSKRKFNGIAMIIVAVIQLVILLILANIIGGVAIVSGAINFTILIFFAIFMEHRTKKGVLMKEKLLGFKLYLETAEKDRIKFHNAPEKKPEVFEKFLPYAMVFGVEKEWAEQFKNIYQGQQDWYQDSSGQPLNSLALASGLNSFTKTASASAFSSPSSASSGGSGFSGGGAGGGFGGGGGGSW